MTTVENITGEIKEKLNALLLQAIHIENSDKGTLQVFDPGKEVLLIIAQVGFDKKFLEHFKEVKAFDSSACGRAMGTGNTIKISDIKLDTSFAPHLEIALNAGYRAVKSIPLRFTSGKFAGVMSLHYKEPQLNWKDKNISSVCSAIADLLEAVPLHSISI